MRQGESAPPSSGSLRFGHEARVLQSHSSSEIPLFPLSPAGQKAEQCSLSPTVHPPWGAQGGQPSPRAGQKGRGVAVSAGLVWPVPNFPRLLPLPRHAAAGSQQGQALACPQCWPNSSCIMLASLLHTMPAFLHGLGQLLAVVVLVLQPAGSLGECHSPAHFLCFCGSSLLADQTRKDQVRKIQREPFLWLQPLLIPFCAWCSCKDNLSSVVLLIARFSSCAARLDTRKEPPKIPSASQKSHVGVQTPWERC